MAALPPATIPPLFPPRSSDTSVASTQQSSADDTSTTSASTAVQSQTSTSTTDSSTTSSTTTTTADSSTTSSSVLSTSSSDLSTSSSQSSSSTTTTSVPSTTSTAVGPLSTSSSIETVTGNPTSTPTPTATPTPTPSPIVAVTTSDGRVMTITETTIAPGATHVNSQDNSSSKGFFHNTGEVAGVFTVVGLIAVVLIVALLTNAVRRRRAKRFDQDVAQAAAEAAAAGHAPAFTDDDDYGYAADPMRERDTAERSYTGYSDNSHGTYAQQPLQPGENYNMNEFASFDPYAASAAGAAGIGAAGVNRAKSVGRTQPGTPYHAFAGPTAPDPVPAIPNPFYDPPTSTGGYDSQNSANQYRPRNAAASPDLLDAAGLSRNPSQSANASLGRNTSSGSTALNTATSPSNYSYASHYPPAGYPPNAYHPQQAQDGALPGQYQPNGRPSSTGGDDIYGGYLETEAHSDPSPSGQSTSPESMHPNPYSPMDSQSPRPMSAGTSLPEYTSEIVDGHTGGVPVDQEESRYSMRDEEDYGYNGGRRILKVANE